MKNLFPGLSKSDETDAGISVEKEAMQVQINNYEKKIAQLNRIVQEKGREIDAYKKVGAVRDTLV